MPAPPPATTYDPAAGLLRRGVLRRRLLWYGGGLAVFLMLTLVPFGIFGALQPQLSPPERLTLVLLPKLPTLLLGAVLLATPHRSWAVWLAMALSLAVAAATLAVTAVVLVLVPLLVVLLPVAGLVVLVAGRTVWLGWLMLAARQTEAPGFAVVPLGSFWGE